MEDILNVESYLSKLKVVSVRYNCIEFNHNLKIRTSHHDLDGEINSELLFDKYTVEDFEGLTFDFSSMDLHSLMIEESSNNLPIRELKGKGIYLVPNEKDVSPIFIEGKCFTDLPEDSEYINLKLVVIHGHYYKEVNLSECMKIFPYNEYEY